MSLRLRHGAVCAGTVIAIWQISELRLFALVMGVVVGLFQALTSVQEMTLTFVPKVGAMIAVFWVSMSFMTATLVSFFTDRLVPLIAGGL